MHKAKRVHVGDFLRTPSSPAHAVGMISVSFSTVTLTNAGGGMERVRGVARARVVDGEGVVDGAGVEGVGCWAVSSTKGTTEGVDGEDGLTLCVAVGGVEWTAVMVGLGCCEGVERFLGGGFQ
jgi:hypothetical protein